MAELLGLRWRLVLLMALALAPLSLLVLLAVFYPVDVAAMRTTVLGAAALAVVTGVAGSAWVGMRMVVRPVRDMLRMVHQVEAGDVHAVLQTAPRTQRDELARLGRAISRMAAQARERLGRQDRLLREAGQSQALQDQIINSMREGVIAVDLDGRFLLFNQAAQRFYQVLEPGQTLADWRQWHELYHPDGVTPVATDERPFARAVRGESVDDCEMLVRVEDMSDRTLSCNIRPLRSAQQIVGALVVFTEPRAWRPS